MQHINPISLPEFLFHIERNGGELVNLETNRIRRSAWLMMLLLYPLLAISIRKKMFRKKYRANRKLNERHIQWMLRPANLMGRITIVVARKRTASS